MKELNWSIGSGDKSMKIDFTLKIRACLCGEKDSRRTLCDCARVYVAKCRFSSVPTKMILLAHKNRDSIAHNINIKPEAAAAAAATAAQLKHLMKASA